MARHSAGAERSREPGARRERSPAPTGEVPRIFQLGTALGNRTTTALLAGGLLQRKVAIGPADDPLEREADRVAERVLSQSENAAESISSAGAAVQRQCAACAAGGQPCAECEKKDEELRRQEAGQPAGGPAPAQLDSHLATLGPGRPLPNDLRGYFEPRFDHDFSAVRLHTGSAADAAARAAHARAFTLSQDVVFAAGEYTPETRGGRRLLAHELAHVVQQAPPAVRRQAATAEAPTSETSMPPTVEAETTAEPSSEPTPQESKTEAVEPRSGEAPKGLIVADEAEPGPGQMTRSAFLDELHTAACTAAEAGLAGTGRDAQGCPWIERYFQLYRGMSAERLESDLLRYVPATRGATTARDYIAPTAEHIRNSVKLWAETGELTGVPGGLPGMGLLGAIGGSLAGIGRMLFKARSGGAQGAAQPAAVAAQLGEGSPLSGSARSRMEHGLGTGLGGVRLHTDATAARLANRHNARAFTVGRHVAFGAGEYRPGTLTGDALLAHELAHTVQQRAGSLTAGSSEQGGSSRPWEQDADRSAWATVALLWTGRKASAQPRLASSLRLQRCADDKKEEQAAKAAQAAGEKGTAKTPADTKAEAKKGTSTSAIKIVGHGVAADTENIARERAEEVIGGMREPATGKLKGATIELHIIPKDKKLTDLEEFKHLKGTKTFDGREYDDLRGVGGVKKDDTIRYAVAEEQLIAVPDKPSGYAVGFVASHESGHIVEQFGLTEEQQKELQTAYDNRKKADGPWLSPAWYTKSGTGEYFAQSTAAYFGRPYSSSDEDKKTYTREWLKSNDKEMYDLLKKIYK